jgi:hypothetical protein
VKENKEREEKRKGGNIGGGFTTFHCTHLLSRPREKLVFLNLPYLETHKKILFDKKQNNSFQKLEFGICNRRMPNHDA